jgi:hypothetical protein
MNGTVQGFEVRAARPAGLWERSAHWVAPLLTAALVGLAVLYMYDSCGTSLI